MDDTEILLNTFATRCFRNMADRDYITARMCYRAGLISQFHWAALQTFEKYYKAILLYNRVKAKDVFHSLSKAQKKAKQLPFEIKLSPISEKFLRHIDTFGRFRYLEASYFIYGPKLVELDKSVWELRRYCRVIDYCMDIKGKAVKMLEKELKFIEAAEQRPPQEFCIIGGELEKIIKNKSDAARPHLIWQNGFYGKSKRKVVSVPTPTYVENSPFSLDPHILKQVCEYVHIPKEVVSAYANIPQKK